MSMPRPQEPAPDEDEPERTRAVRRRPAPREEPLDEADLAASFDLGELDQADLASAELGPAGDESLPAAEACDDREFVRRAQAGDERAFEALVRRHEQRAFRVARNMVPSDEDARDLAQDAFLRVFKSLDRFDFQHEFTTWLYRIVTNLAIDHLRKRRPVVRAKGRGDDDDDELDFADPDAEDPSRQIDAAETARDVRACIASLAPHFQAVLTLRELEGLACTEIARIVGATHVTVRWRLHRGRKLFQEEWERRERMGMLASAAHTESRPASNASEAFPVPRDKAGKHE